MTTIKHYKIEPIVLCTNRTNSTLHYVSKLSILSKRSFKGRLYVSVLLFNVALGT